MKGLEKLIRQLQSLQKGYVAALRWPEIENEAHLLQAYIHTFNPKLHILTVEDWNHEGSKREIKIDPRKSPQLKINELHNAVKRHKASLIRLIRQINEKKEAIANFIEIKTIEPVSQIRKKKEPYLSFTSETGLTILVGKNAPGNDIVTFRLAHGNDLWMHAAHEKGAHVIVRLPKGSICDDKTFNEALQLALKHSQADKKGEAEVVVALKKFVSKPPKGKPGQAQVAKPRLYKVVKN